MTAGGSSAVARFGSAHARICTTTGQVGGAGFLVGPNIVATCAHVIAFAAGTDPNDVQPPDSIVAVDFPLLPLVGARRARVRRWTPIAGDGRGDIAILELDDAVGDSVVPPPFWRAIDPWGREFRMFGFPAELPDGVWASGEFRERQGTGWLQLQRVGGQPITRGFSGAPVWDSGTDAVVGMAAVADPRGYTGTAFMIPIAEVLGMDPAFVPNPYRGLEPFDEEHADYFYGRDDDIDRALAALRQRPFVAVAGPSGIGKSSLIRAGVIPRLRAQGRQIATFRLAGEVSPGDAATPVVRAMTPRFDFPDGGRLSTLLAEQAARAPGTVDDSVARLLERVPPEGLVLFADQFEDLAATAPERARAVLQWLMELTRADTEGRIRILLTLRWDALNNLIDADLASFLDGATVPLAPMGRDQLRAAIQRPADHAPGVDLQPALVERLVDDTVGEPGALPLLESTLTQLWDRRGSASLTIDDYEKVGRATGFFTERADQVLAQFTNPVEEFDVRRLLKLLAAPASSGESFVRSVVSMGDFPELRSVAGRLARDRLVVVGRDAQGTDIVELAHQALIDNWSRLRGWLQDDRDFRAWQQQIERDRQKWELSEHDNGALLHGKTLEDALDWVDKRKPEIPAAHRLYVAASRRLRRREVRRLWTVTAVVTVLALVASGTAIVAYRTSQARTAQLREQAGINLAQQSEVLGNTDPSRALQFAQAAGRFAPDNADVRAGQLLEQVRLGSLEAAYNDLWSDVKSADFSVDGSVLATAESNGNVTVWTGFLSGPPSPWRVATVPNVIGARMSPDGGKLAILNDRGGIALWDVSTRSGPVTVRPDGADVVGRTALVAKFSQDGRQLFISVDPQRGHGTYLGDPDVIERYDLSGPPHRLPDIPADGMPTRIIARVDSANETLWLSETDVDLKVHRVIYDLKSGRPVRDWPGRYVTPDGLTVECTDDAKTLIIRGADGAERRRVGLGTCGSLRLDSTGQFAIEYSGENRDAFGIAKLVHIATGRVYQVQVRHSSDAVAPAVHLTAAGPVLIYAASNGIERYGAAAESNSDWPEITPDDVTALWSPDGRYVAGSRGETFEVIDMQSMRLLFSLPGFTLRIWPHAMLAFTPDGRHALMWTGTSRVAVVLMPAFDEIGRIPLPTPSGLNSADSSFVTFAIRDDDEVAALYAGAITRWHIGDGRQIGGQVLLSHNLDDLRTPAKAATLVGYASTDSVVVNIAGTSLQLWNLDSGALVRSFELPGEGVANVHMNPGNTEVLVRDDSGALFRWNTATGESAKLDIPPVPHDSVVAGWSPDGLVVLGNKSEVEVWDTRTGTSTKFTVPGSTMVWKLIGTTLIGLSDQGPIRINLDRNNIQQRLCAISDRDYTEAERDKIPRGVDSKRPCESD
ncbi:trypsin-like peptidase domain-containing protein [Nocardia sp. NPDC049526]|uniref:nSTAND1 domain-containing NTPase n=1 Tax=Nocardia sp. NPDC049526 TaxID=3364316 RepID=UPI00379D95E8